MPWLHVVGIGDDGLTGCVPEAATLISDAEIIVGAPRQLELTPDTGAERIAVTGNWRAAIQGLSDCRGRRVVLLASGDPLVYGVGGLIAEFFSTDEVRVVPHVSSFALVCARLLWPQADVHLVRLTGAATEQLERVLRPGRRIVVLSADDASPRHVAAMLISLGYGASQMEIFEHLGGTKERHLTHNAAAFSEKKHGADIARLNTLALTCIRDDAAMSDLSNLSSVPGLAEDVFAHDGQITKQEVRAITLAKLAPRPGELLWDIGLGSGAIAIEWLRAATATRAIGVERNMERAARARRNAKALGVPQLEIVEGEAPAILNELMAPDAIFVGGGLTASGLVETCWQALKPGGRLVANAVTLESEAVLLAAHRAYGGAMSRISIERSDAVGTMTGWRPAMTVTQWVVCKPVFKDGTAQADEASL